VGKSRGLTSLIRSFQRNRAHVATSFYSDDPVIHEQITQGKGSWQRTVGGIERVLAAGLPIRVGVIETERNVGHWCSSPANLAQRFLQLFGLLNPRKRGGANGQSGCGDAFVAKSIPISGNSVSKCGARHEPSLTRCSAQAARRSVTIGKARCPPWNFTSSVN
jgi:hypothetical protein